MNLNYEQIFGIMYIIVTTSLFIAYCTSEVPNKISKVVFWPLWFITELTISLIEWYNETIDRLKN